MSAWTSRACPRLQSRDTYLASTTLATTAVGLWRRGKELEHAEVMREENSAGRRADMRGDAAVSLARGRVMAGGRMRTHGAT